jgi:hypothetical protein
MIYKDLRIHENKQTISDILRIIINSILTYYYPEYSASPITKLPFPSNVGVSHILETSI